MSKNDCARCGQGIEAGELYTEVHRAYIGDHVHIGWSDDGKSEYRDGVTIITRGETELIAHLDCPSRWSQHD